MRAFCLLFSCWCSSDYRSAHQVNLQGDDGKYESGEVVSFIEVVKKKIADAPEVSIDQLVYGDQDNKAEQSISDRELLSMFQKIQLLNERQKETVKDFLSSYILKSDLKQKLA